MQSSLDHTPFVEGDVSHVPIITHLIQPIFEEVVVQVQTLYSPNVFLEGVSSFNYVVIIYDSAHSKQERVLLSSSTLTPSPGEVPFDWDGVVGYPMPLPMSFQVRDII
jgi:hypothetical protein